MATYQQPSLSEFISLGRAIGSGISARREQKERDEIRRKAEARQQELANATADRTVDDAGFSLANAQGGRERIFTGPQGQADMQEAMRDETMNALVTQGQPTESLSLSQARPRYRVSGGGQESFTTEKPNAMALNSLDAKLDRAANVMLKYDPNSAVTLSNTAAAQRKARRAESDDDIERNVFGAQTPQALADFVSKTLSDQMGTQVRAEYVASPDGKSWVLGINVNGQRQPIGQFSNDAAGLQKAQEAIFNRMGSPEARRALEKHKADIAAKGRTNTPNTVGEDRKTNTNAMNAAERLARDKRRTLDTLRKNQIWSLSANKEGTPENQQLQSLEAEIREAEDEALHYRNLLAGDGAYTPRERETSTQAPRGAATPPKPAATPSGGPAQPKSKAEYDALPKGARYIKNGVEYIKK